MKTIPSEDDDVSVSVFNCIILQYVCIAIDVINF